MGKPFEMISLAPFWRIVVFSRARERSGQSVSAGAFGSICCDGVSFEVERLGWSAYHLFAESFELHHVGREHYTRRSRPVEDDRGVVLALSCTLALARPAYT